MSPRCFVVGHPIAHSRSPLIHGEWLRQYGIAGSYERVDVAPADLPAFIRRLRDGEFAGGNVTVPHKEAVMALVDAVSDAGRAVGAVNTLWRENGRILADNSDVPGFLAHLDATVPGWQERVRTALILGAGGAARGICYGLKARGVDRILVVNRSPGRAEELVAAFERPLEAGAWDRRDRLVAEADLIVNTTALGMQGKPPLELDLSRLRPGTIVDDIVYVPLKTALLAEAEGRGGIPVDGLGMLLHQAVPGFARWFGVTPQVTPALHALIEADILKA
ncbi:Shikimate dehydrogenase (NADP(+)) [Hyphomicrobiales bacterium]|nr:Shikimate dehydrogenase (NADP(+)) [Hyphomicrobiales bacterium]CAH1698222.1 Shikimate dehydrogenase (NADP(+)) [Hyphomicrobiales bacterium]CAI0347866.1 Shikimate dehydrogenase (NADP(+)) [Hyphomicrobiales bacterium]